MRLFSGNTWCILSIETEENRKEKLSMKENQCPWEKEVQELGREIFEAMGEEKPSIFTKDYWGGKIIHWCMENPVFKAQMFRLIDVLPSIKSSKQVAQHLKEYLFAQGVEVPQVLQKTISSILSNPLTAPIAAQQMRKNIEDLANHFIVGPTPQEAIPKLKLLWSRGIFFTVDLLGEASVSEKEAEEYLRRYLEVMDILAREIDQWPTTQPEREREFPRLSISIKLSSLYSRLDPVNFDGSISRLKERLRPIFRKVSEVGGFVNLDMESFALCELTNSTFMSLLDEDEFSSSPRAGIVIQTYLKNYKENLERLIHWARSRDRQITLRLVKGAYWDYERVLAMTNNWPLPVFTQKGDTDAAFEKATRYCLENYPLIRTAIATHNIRSIAHGLVSAQKMGLRKEALEIQMLYGMAEPVKKVLVEMGYPLTEYCPIGDLVPGMAYLIRRLLENTSNESFLRKSFVRGLSVEELMAHPEAKCETKKEAVESPRGMGDYRREPPLNFAVAIQRESFARSLVEVAKRSSRIYPLFVDGKEIKTGRKLASFDPAKPNQEVGYTYLATLDEVRRALESATRAFPQWRETPVEDRVRLVLRLGEILRSRRLELAALQVYEVSKNWKEADADVCEAIDFCEYYAREMMRLGRVRELDPVPGETNQYVYQAKGPVLVVAPWNFPLAISCGMVVAALVTGNTVIYKPSSLSPATGGELARAIREAGFPKGTFHFLPCFGNEAATWLVEDPRVALIAFTGSKEVGLEILLRAASLRPGQENVKRVIAEMGGKNAIIVDADADLDSAVVGVMESAFGFQGQKCSACSRAIVVEDQYHRFVERLVEATKGLKVGHPSDPSVDMGALIDPSAKKKVEEYIELGMKEAQLLFKGECSKEGYFVGPTIFGSVPPESRLGQEEIFGPVLSVMKADDIEHALEIANSTPYALTGGIYSRSPSNIEKAKREMRVGNLYINRKITGAIVGRQPFGGFKMSGMGSKTGGPDYLLQFMEPRTITENTLRKGFVPELG